MKHYIVTNRQVKKDSNGKEYITNDGYEAPSSVLRFGTVDAYSGEIDIFPDIEVNANGSINYSDNTWQGKGSNRLFTELDEFLSDSNNELVMFIHGFGNATHNIQKFTKQLHESYVEGQTENRIFMTFYWTTNGKKLNIDDYRADSLDSIYAGRALAKLFARWTDWFERHDTPQVDFKGKFHLLVQSMGNQVLQYTIEYLKTINHPLAFDFDEVILVGADVEKQVFRKGNAFETLADISERVHVYGQRKDKALKISKIIWTFLDSTKRKRLGQGYGKSEIAPHLDNVYACDIRQATREEFLLNKEEIVQHWYFVESLKVVKDMNVVFDGGDSAYYKS